MTKPWWLKPRGVSMLVIGLSVLVYANALDNPFHYDDFHSIVLNRHLMDIHNIPAFFTSVSMSSLFVDATAYRPLLQISYVLNYYWGGHEPWGYHAVNLVLHMGISFLIYSVVRSFMNDSLAALYSSLIFAVHPLNAEAINYVAARSSILCAFFYILSFRFYIAYRCPTGPVQKNKQRLFYGGSLLIFVLALLTKEIAITLPVVMALYDYYFHSVPGSKGIRSHLLDHLPFWVAAIFYLLIWQVLMGSPLPSGGGPETEANWYGALLMALVVVSKYVELLLLPFSLNIEHGLPQYGSLLEWPVLVSVGILGSLVLLALGFNRIFKRGVFWVAWFFITILPLMILPFMTNVAIFQEHRGYLPVVGIVILMGTGLSGLTRRLRGGQSTRLIPISVGIFLGLLLTGYAGLVVHRNTVWQSDVKLWADAVKKSPSSYFPHLYLAIAYDMVGQTDLARHEFQQATQINPELTKNVLEHALIETTIRKVQREIQIRPTDYLLHLDLGKIYGKIHRFDWALQEFQTALDHEPNSPVIYHHMGLAYYDLGKFTQAIQYYQKALRRFPTNSSIYNNLGNAYKKAGDFSRAAESYQTALRVDSGYALAHYNLAGLEEERGDYPLARSHYHLFLESARDETKYESYIRATRERLALLE